MEDLKQLGWFDLPVIQAKNGGHGKMSDIAQSQNQSSQGQRERILNAAVRCFIETGDRTVNISKLAQEASIARGTIYNNFGSDEDLFDLACKKIAANIHTRFTEIQAEFAKPAERVAAMLTALLRLTHQNPSIGQFFMHFAPSTPALRAIWNGEIPDELKAGRRSGDLSFGNDLLTTVQLISGACYAMIVVVVEGQRGWREVAEILIENVLIMLQYDNAAIGTVVSKVTSAA